MEEKKEEIFDVLDEYGNPTGEKATRTECHKKGIYHGAVAVFIVNEKDEVLLQRRSTDSVMWAEEWDLSAGGHIDSGEEPLEAIHRELKEELGLDVDPKRLRFLDRTTSEHKNNDIINRHHNFNYVCEVDDLKIEDLKLQREEVIEVRWASKKEIIERIENNYNGITNKKGSWGCLLKYYRSKEKTAKEVSRE